MKPVVQRTYGSRASRLDELSQSHPHEVGRNDDPQDVFSYALSAADTSVEKDVDTSSDEEDAHPTASSLQPNVKMTREVVISGRAVVFSEEVQYLLDGLLDDSLEVQFQTIRGLATFLGDSYHRESFRKERHVLSLLQILENCLLRWEKLVPGFNDRKTSMDTGGNKVNANASVPTNNSDHLGGIFYGLLVAFALLLKDGVCVNLDLFHPAVVRISAFALAMYGNETNSLQSTLGAHLNIPSDYQRPPIPMFTPSPSLPDIRKGIFSALSPEESQSTKRLDSELRTPSPEDVPAQSRISTLQASSAVESRRTSLLGIGGGLLRKASQKDCRTSLPIKDNDKKDNNDKKNQASVIGQKRRSSDVYETGYSTPSQRREITMELTRSVMAPLGTRISASSAQTILNRASRSTPDVATATASISSLYDLFQEVLCNAGLLPSNEGRSSGQGSSVSGSISSRLNSSDNAQFCEDIGNAHIFDKQHVEPARQACAHIPVIAKYHHHRHLQPPAMLPSFVHPIDLASWVLWNLCSTTNPDDIEYFEETWMPSQSSLSNMNEQGGVSIETVNNPSQNSEIVSCPTGIEGRLMRGKAGVSSNSPRDHYALLDSTKEKDPGALEISSGEISIVDLDRKIEHGETNSMVCNIVQTSGNRENLAANEILMKCRYVRSSDPLAVVATSQELTIAGNKCREYFRDVYQGRFFAAFLECVTNQVVQLLDEFANYIMNSEAPSTENHPIQSLSGNLNRADTSHLPVFYLLNRLSLQFSLLSDFLFLSEQANNQLLAFEIDLAPLTLLREQRQEVYGRTFGSRRNDSDSPGNHTRGECPTAHDGIQQTCLATSYERKGHSFGHNSTSHRSTPPLPSRPMKRSSSSTGTTFLQYPNAGADQIADRHHVQLLELFSVLLDVLTDVSVHTTYNYAKIKGEPKQVGFTRWHNLILPNCTTTALLQLTLRIFVNLSNNNPYACKRIVSSDTWILRQTLLPSWAPFVEPSQGPQHPVPEENANTLNPSVSPNPSPIPALISVPGESPIQGNFILALLYNFVLNSVLYRKENPFHPLIIESSTLEASQSNTSRISYVPISCISYDTLVLVLGCLTNLGEFEPSFVRHCLSGTFLDCSMLLLDSMAPRMLGCPALGQLTVALCEKERPTADAVTLSTMAYLPCLMAYLYNRLNLLPGSGTSGSGEYISSTSDGNNAETFPSGGDDEDQDPAPYQLSPSKPLLTKTSAGKKTDVPAAFSGGSVEAGTMENRAVMHGRVQNSLQVAEADHSTPNVNNDRGTLEVEPSCEAQNATHSTGDTNGPVNTSTDSFDVSDLFLSYYLCLTYWLVSSGSSLTREEYLLTNERLQSTIPLRNKQQARYMEETSASPIDSQAHFASNSQLSSENISHDNYDTSSAVPLLPWEEDSSKVQTTGRQPNSSHCMEMNDPVGAPATRPIEAISTAVSPSSSEFRTSAPCDSGGSAQICAPSCGLHVLFSQYLHQRHTSHSISPLLCKPIALDNACISCQQWKRISAQIIDTCIPIRWLLPLGLCVQSVFSRSYCSVPSMSPSHGPEPVYPLDDNIGSDSAFNTPRHTHSEALHPNANDAPSLYKQTALDSAVIYLESIFHVFQRVQLRAGLWDEIQANQSEKILSHLSRVVGCTNAST